MLRNLLLIFHLRILTVLANSNSDYDYYSELTDAFQEGFEHDHDHDINDVSDEHGHHKQSIEESSKKDYDKMSIEEKMFYRFKEVDLDDDDKLDGIELYNQAYKTKFQNYEDYLKKYQNLMDHRKKLYQLGELKFEDTKKMSDEKMADTMKSITKMKEALEEPSLINYVDHVLSSFDKDLNGFITWNEYMPKDR